MIYVSPYKIVSSIPYMQSCFVYKPFLKIYFCLIIYEHGFFCLSCWSNHFDFFFFFFTFPLINFLYVLCNVLEKCLNCFIILNIQKLHNILLYKQCTMCNTKVIYKISKSVQYAIHNSLYEQCTWNSNNIQYAIQNSFINVHSAHSVDYHQIVKIQILRIILLPYILMLLSSIVEIKKILKFIKMSELVQFDYTSILYKINSYFKKM